ncbi:hypothetical protein G6F32_016850 [Rhizopus arrhizus]|nr:hypothetical protein G6F32_016850 [Rhizopus arrhizus]
MRRHHAAAAQRQRQFGKAVHPHRRRQHRVRQMGVGQLRVLGASFASGGRDFLQDGTRRPAAAGGAQLLLAQRHPGAEDRKKPVAMRKQGRCHSGSAA